MVKFEKNLKVKYNVDVLVAGGGPSGVAAATAAARNGAKVLLIEKGECLGGAATACKVPAFMRFSDGENFLSGGIGREIFDKLYPEGTDFTVIEHSIDAEKLKCIYDDMMKEAGADFLFDTVLCDVAEESGNVNYAVLMGREELFAVKAKIYIDATGNGTLAVKAGAKAYKGDENGNMMPATLCSVWGDIDWNRAVVEIGKDPDNRCLSRAFEENVFTVKDTSLPGMWRFDRHYGGGNIGHVFGVDGTDERSVTTAMTEARARMKEYVTYYNRYLAGYENAKLISTADVLGIRETRRVDCEYNAANDDYFNYAVFEDEIGRYAYPMDVHSYKIGAKSKYKDVYAKGYAKGKSYGISYRSLLPKNTQNVLVCGRCIGAEREIMGSLRVMPACFITGMAAGTAAALSVRHGVSLREVDKEELKITLFNMGAYLPNLNKKIN